MNHTFGELRHAYKKAFGLSILFFLDFMLRLRTYKHENLLIKLLNAFLLIIPISLWIRLLFNREWLLFTPISLVLFAILLFFVLTPNIPEITMTEEELLAYEQSPQWKLRKEQTLIRDNFCCQTCKSKENLRIERLTDTNIGRENLYELTTICENCYLFPNKKLKFETKLNQ